MSLKRHFPRTIRELYLDPLADAMFGRGQIVNIAIALDFNA
jgi:hypothetical protein